MEGRVIINPIQTEDTQYLKEGRSAGSHFNDSAPERPYVSLKMDQNTLCMRYYLEMEEGGGTREGERRERGGREKGE